VTIIRGSGVLLGGSGARYRGQSEGVWPAASPKVVSVHSRANSASSSKYVVPTSSAQGPASCHLLRHRMLLTRQQTRVQRAFR